MTISERMNEPLAAAGGVGRPAVAPGSRPVAGGAPAGATSSPVRACLFCRYRRLDEQKRELPHA